MTLQQVKMRSRGSVPCRAEMECKLVCRCRNGCSRDRVCWVPRSDLRTSTSWAGSHLVTGPGDKDSLGPILSVGCVRAPTHLAVPGRSQGDEARALVTLVPHLPARTSASQC